MVDITESLISCGIYELSGLHHSSKDIICQLAFDDFFPGCICLFSDAVRHRNGRRFAKFIIENNLGEVHVSKIVRNPNSRNNIELFTWYPDFAELRKLFNKYGKEDSCGREYR